jgi:alginate O-acetyltransferase complex protein AlgI
MAIGCARILGFRFNRNFYMPYISQNITEFWRRWHISLSTWLRDYLYISLGGNRHGKNRTYINLMITMILGGLWHGASWNFVIWGTMHGSALAIHKMWNSYFKRENHNFSAMGWLSTLLFVMSVWVLFRSQDSQTALTVYSKMLFINSAGAEWYYHAAFWAIGISILGHLVGFFRTEEDLVLFKSPYSYRAAFVVVTTLWIIYIFAPTNLSPFIYFQF